MERADAHGRLQACKQPFDRQRGVRGHRDRDGRVLIAAYARDHRHDRAVEGGNLQTEHARRGSSFAGGPGSATTTADGLTVRNAAGASAHLVSTMGKAPAVAERFDESRRRLLGDHDQWALKRHWGARAVYRMRTTLEVRC